MYRGEEPNFNKSVFIERILISDLSWLSFRHICSALDENPELLDLMNVPSSTYVLQLLRAGQGPLRSQAGPTLLLAVYQ